MIHRFLITAAHTTLIRQRETLKHEIIQDKDPTMNCCPQKEGHPFRNLNFPQIPFHGKLEIEAPQILL